MPGLLLHSPADIVSRLLISLGHGVAPPGATWPIYVDSEPDAPDNCITVQDVAGRIGARNHIDGERHEYHGILMRVRSTTHVVGYAKARAIATAIDEDVSRDTVTIDGTDYCVATIVRTSDVLRLGKDSPNTKRNLFTINAVAYLRPAA